MKPMRNLLRYLTLILSLCACSGVWAQQPASPTTPNAPITFIPPVQDFQLQPPPVGDGSQPAAEIKGDTGTPQTVPTDTADKTNGSWFKTMPGGATIAPVLVPGTRRGIQVMQYTETAPYPQTTMITIGGKQYQYINSDSPAPGYPKEQNSWFYGGLPTVQTLSRFLIIAAVVIATILMAWAAYAVVMGQDGAGARVIGTAGGLILLLMSFTIWKIIQANAAGYNDQGKWDTINDGLPPRIILPTQLQTQYPAQPNRPARSGVPVLPDSGN